MHLAQLQLRSGDIRAARTSFATLIERGDGGAEERLFRLMSFITQEDASDADKLMRALAKPYEDSALVQYAMGAVALQAESKAMANMRHNLGRLSETSAGMAAGDVSTTTVGSQSARALARCCR